MALRGQASYAALVKRSAIERDNSTSTGGYSQAGDHSAGVNVARPHQDVAGTAERNGTSSVRCWRLDADNLNRLEIALTFLDGRRLLRLFTRPKWSIFVRRRTAPDDVVVCFPGAERARHPCPQRFEHASIIFCRFPLCAWLGGVDSGSVGEKRRRRHASHSEFLPES
jgi:hypothetical protein